MISSVMNWKAPASIVVRMFGSSSSLGRWHKDTIKNRRVFRWGHQDKGKRTGALPRISEDEENWSVKDVYTPENPFAQKRALFGQNDYIDILGEDPDMFRPSELNYSQPEWLREIRLTDSPYLRMLYKKKMLQETEYPETHPGKWELLNRRIDKQYGKLRKRTDQYQFSNYRGIAVGDVGSRTRTNSKYPF